MSQPLIFCSPGVVLIEWGQKVQCLHNPDFKSNKVYRCK